MLRTAEPSLHAFDPRLFYFKTDKKIHVYQGVNMYYHMKQNVGPRKARPALLSMQRDCPDDIGCGERGFHCSGGAKEAIVIPAWKLVS